MELLDIVLNDKSLIIQYWPISVSCAIIFIAWIVLTNRRSSKIEQWKTNETADYDEGRFSKINSQ